MNNVNLEEYCKAQIKRWHFSITRSQYKKATQICMDVMREVKENINGIRDQESECPGLFIGKIFKGLIQFTEVYKLSRNKNWYYIPNIVEKSWDIYIGSRYALNDTRFFLNESFLPFNKFVYDFCMYFEKTILDTYGPGMYISPTLVIKDIRCNICGSDFRRCSHQRQMIYDGKMCKPLIHEFVPVETSVVDSPRDRRCRIWPWNTDAETRSYTAKVLIASDEE